MRRATNTIGAILGTASVVAAAGMTSQAVAGAEPTAPAAPTAPAGHQVRYTVSSAAPYDFDLYYLTAQPPSKAAYDADAYAFVKQEKITVTPDAPWVFETTLADPQWAIVTVSSTTRGTVGAPSAHCDITVDGQVAVQQDHPYSPRCQLGQW